MKDGAQEGPGWVVGAVAAGTAAGIAAAGTAAAGTAAVAPDAGSWRKRL